MSFKSERPLSHSTCACTNAPTKIKDNTNIVSTGDYEILFHDKWGDSKRHEDEINMKTKIEWESDEQLMTIFIPFSHISNIITKGTWNHKLLLNKGFDVKETIEREV